MFKIFLISDKMRYNKIFLITIALLIVLSLQAVCAADINGLSDNSAVAANNNQATVERSPLSSNVNDTYITANNISSYNPNVTYTATLTNGNGTPLSNKTINIFINNESFNETTDVNGTIFLNLSLKPGTYNIVSNFTGVGNYTASSITNTIEINSTIVSKDIVKIFKNDTQYYATFLDFNGNPIAYTNITFEIYGQKYIRKTNGNGTAKLNINLNPGVFNIKATNPLTNESVINNITVLSSINGDNIVKIYKNGTQYYATFLNADGTPLANRNVTFNIYGVIYTRSTDANGTSHLNINLHPGKYIITATNPVNNQKCSNNITVLSSISGHNIVKYYRNGTQYYATFLNADGTPLANRNVTFNIYGVIYTRSTDANGSAKLNINLHPGHYTITATNPVNNQTYSNNISVLSKIVVKDITVNYKAGGKYSAKVLDDMGKPVANATVSLNIYGRIYNKTSDANGTVYLNINLNPGTYIITAKCNDSTISSKVTVNKVACSLSILNPTLKKGSYLKVKMEDGSKNPVGGRLVLIIYNNRAYGAYTDGNGIAKIRIGLNPGSYQFIVAIQNDPFYQNIASYNTIKVTS